MPRQSHSPLFDNFNTAWWVVQNTELHIMPFSPAELRTITLVIIKGNNNPQKENEQFSLRLKHRVLAYKSGHSMWRASFTIRPLYRQGKATHWSLKEIYDFTLVFLAVLDDTSKKCRTSSGSTCTFLFVRLHKGCTFSLQEERVTLNHGTPIPLALCRCSLHLVIKMKGA